MLEEGFLRAIDASGSRWPLTRGCKNTECNQRACHLSDFRAISTMLQDYVGGKDRRGLEHMPLRSFSHSRRAVDRMAPVGARHRQTCRPDAGTHDLDNNNHTQVNSERDDD